MTDIKLTEKQELFCKEYLVDLNATQAAIRAGYTEKSARVTSCKMLTNANIAERIQQLMRVREEKVQINAEWVLVSAKQVFDRCMQAEQVTDKDGNSMGEYKFEHSGANKALEIIGKHVKVRAFDREEEKKSDTQVIINIVDAVAPDES